jgi:biopolymer transport protein ExbD
MLCNRAKPLKPIFTLDGTTFPIVMAITVVMVLFIPMTFTTPHRGLGPDLPIVDHPIQMPDAERADAVVVGITRDERIYFGTEQVTADELPAKIREQFSHGGERKVYIRADGRVRYGRVGAVLDGVRSAGVIRIGILTD